MIHKRGVDLAYTLQRWCMELGVYVADDTATSFILLASELKKWNRRFNLTTITDDDEIAIKHILDSLMLASRLSDKGRLLDIGSGAGFPAIPVKMFIPQLTVFSVDAVLKKVLFQRHITRLLALKGFEAMHARAETVAKSHPHTFDVIVSRAFSRIDRFAELALPLLAAGGRLFTMKGPGAGNEMTSAHTSLAKLGCMFGETYSYKLPSEMGERQIISILPVESP